MSEFDVLNELKQPEQVAQEVNYSSAEIYDKNPDIRRGQLMERLKLKNKILAYQEKFTKELNVYNYKMEKLDEFSNEDLEVFLDEIKLCVRQRNSASMTKGMYFGAVNFVEKTSTKLGYDITGFHNVLYSQEEVHKCLDEISLEYEDSVYMPAYVRLPYITLQVAMSLYQIKKVETIIETGMKQEIKKEIVDEYADL
jgi:hypothetical protein